MGPVSYTHLVSSFDGRKATQTYSLPITASWELDIFGRMRNAKEQAKALFAQSRDYQQAVRTQLIAGIANTYYTCLLYTSGRSSRGPIRQ